MQTHPAHAVDAVLTQLPSYMDRGRVRNELLELLSQCPSLVVKTSPFTMPDRRTTTLIMLEGTFPIHYNNTQYNIPLHMFIPERFPLEPPPCYLRPTPDILCAGPRSPPPAPHPPRRAP
eukprot:tig00021374_g21095.t1